MKAIRTILKLIYSYRLWLISLTLVCLFFVFLAWVAYPQAFSNLIAPMAFAVGAAFLIPLAIKMNQHKRADEAFRQFLLEPDETNEHLLCEVTSVLVQPHIRELGRHLRAQLKDMAEYAVQVTDYENYVESWVHEVKKPLSLITLVLDNRKDEMSPLVQSRMLHARDQMRQNIDQILYFSRLGAAHKDYFWESLSVLSICKESAEDNRTLLDEAGFMIQFSGKDSQIISDKKSLMFILGQIISNSVKYAKKQNTSALHFDVQEDDIAEQITLAISDNGLGIPSSDLPFVFDKGFTGDRGNYLSRSTGMGLYLVQKMAADLAIDLQITSQLERGTTVSLVFPKVQNLVRRFNNGTAEQCTDGKKP